MVVFARKIEFVLVPSSFFFKAKSFAGGNQIEWEVEHVYVCQLLAI
jgi:hypothetical protein